MIDLSVEPAIFAHVEHVMGTTVSFTVYPGEGPAGAARSSISRACALLQRIDATFSTWNPDSVMSRLRRGDLRLDEMPEEVVGVLELCQAAKVVSEGWFDPWALPGGVDPTGLVKGWAVQCAAEIVERAGATGGIVNAGGDLATFGAPHPGDLWRVGIRHPWRPDALACIVEADGAVATSGTYERGLHLFDPRSGRPACRTASATVSGPDLALADALATALAVAGDHLMPTLEALAGHEAYMIRPDGTEEATTGMRFVASTAHGGA